MSGFVGNYSAQTSLGIGGSISKHQIPPEVGPIDEDVIRRKQGKTFAKRVTAEIKAHRFVEAMTTDQEDPWLDRRIVYRRAGQSGFNFIQHCIDILVQRLAGVDLKVLVSDLISEKHLGKAQQEQVGRA